MDDPSVRVDGLRRSFGPVTALDGVDLRLDGPAIVGVAGPNGAGKTTLIEMLLGLLAPDEGTVRVNGVDPLSFDADDRRRLGYMPQHEAVYRDLTVRENVAFFARLYGADDRASAVAAAVDFVGLADRADDRLSELSGGMIRRASLACAVVHDPGVLFLDEPTVGLDPELRATMWDGFRERRDDGTLALVSTHYLGEARHCDRVLFLRNGRVLAFDSPDAFLDRTGTEDLEAAFLALLDDRDPRETALDATDTEEAADV
ncbi:ABC transporter ATP-binding protein [Halostella sp. JP-L12]|uniref:ABC transporter ATP-binding protein n=1 Tax=Halostella TaxID=1843185 RepID=UPI000EF76E2B|nr:MULTISPECIES: ABC transporter ATP-binding protein [Halostella]NHN47934.1 ABC transporter ATP-binding protein [Halostella sp. JP-L12]